jgi:hypothetical protein
MENQEVTSLSQEEPFSLDLPKDPGISPEVYWHILRRWLMVDIFAISVFWTCFFTFLFIVDNPERIPLPQLPLPYFEVQVASLLEVLSAAL